jgi:hypothetical protein
LRFARRRLGHLFR